MTGRDGVVTLRPFLRKLSQLVQLQSGDTDAVELLQFKIAQVARQRDAIARGETVSYLYVVLEGWAARYSLRPDGTRRITGFLLPGDFCGIHAVCHAPMDHAIVALTDCTLAKIELTQVEALVADSPMIGRALWYAKLIDEAILRTWVLNSSDAVRTLAHLLCELDARLHHGTDIEAGPRRFDLPITQEQIGDALGLTSVHINRCFRHLREADLVDITQGRLTIPDVEALRKAAAFDPTYLHWRGDGSGRR